MSVTRTHEFKIIPENFVKGVANGCQKALKQADYLVTNTEALSKISKVALALIGLLTTIFTAFVPGAGAAIDILAKLKIAPGGFVALTNATSIVDRFFDFTDPKQLAAISKNWQKLVGRITLTAGQVLDTVSFLDNVKIIDIGAFGSNAVGNLSIISLVKNSLIAASALLGLCDASKTIRATKGKLDHDSDYKESVIKLGQWEKNNEDEVKKHISEKGKVYNTTTSPKELKNYKIAKYKKLVANARAPITKAWIAIAADASKLAIVVLSSIALMLIVTAPVALVVVASCGLAAATIGLVKTMYGAFGPDQTVPVNTFKTKQDALKN
jgi:hypothetical protein